MGGALSPRARLRTPQVFSLATFQSQHQPRLRPRPRSEQVFVGDDTRESRDIEEVVASIARRRGLNVSCTFLPLDSGEAFGRNRLVEAADTSGYSYVLHADDRFKLHASLLLGKASSLVAMKVGLCCTAVPSAVLLA